MSAKTSIIWDLRPQSNHFTLLRLCLAMAVILAHSQTLFIPVAQRSECAWAVELGDLAVNSFFAISGCLITASWLRSKSARDYLSKRVLRIYPGYLAAGLICVLGFAALGVADVSEYYRQLGLPKYLLDLARLAMIQAHGAFATAPDPYLNGSSWTIQAEFICYLTVPLLMLVVRDRRGLLLALFGGMLALYGIQLFRPDVTWCATSNQSCWYELRVPLPLFWQGCWPRLMSSFLAGAAFLLYRDRIPHSRKLATACALVLLVSTVLTPLFRVAWPVCGTYLLFWIAFHPGFKSPSWMERNDLSYGTYLYAYPIQQVLLRHVPGINVASVFITALPLALACGWVSWQLVEKPALRLKPRTPTIASERDKS